MLPLDSGHLLFHDEPIFDIARLSRSIHRTETHESPSRVNVYSLREASFFFAQKFVLQSFRRHFRAAGYVGRLCRWSGFATSDRSFHVNRLELDGDFLEQWDGYKVITSWLGLLCSFTTVRILHLSREALVAHVVRMPGTLKGKRATDVLPALYALVLRGSQGGASRALQLFILARERSILPLVVRQEDPYGRNPSSE